MTFLDAMNSLEALIGRLGIKDRWGEIVPPDQCFGHLQVMSKGLWGEMLDGVSSGEITVEAFHRAGVALIDRVDRTRYGRKIMRQSIELDKQQIDEGA